MESQNIASRRSLVYWAFLLLFLLGGGPIMISGITISATTHNVLDGLTAIGALVASVAAFVAYRRTKATMLGMVGVTLIGATSLMTLHLVTNLGLVENISPTSIEILDPWTWNLTTFYMGVMFLAMCVYATRTPFGSPETIKSNSIVNPVTAAVFTVVMLAGSVFAVTSLSLPTLSHEGIVLSRTPDFVSGIMLTAALLLLARKGNWRRDSYGHGINILLIGFANIQFFCMPFSDSMLDSSAAAGHILQIISLTAIAGILSYKHRASEAPSETEGVKPIGLGMGAKLAILCGFIALLSVMPLAIKSTRTLHDIAAQNGIQNLAAAAERSSTAITEQRMNASADLNYLAGVTDLEALRQVNSILELPPEEARQIDISVREMGLITRNLLLSNPGYFSVTYVDAISGEPIVRHEQKSKAAIAAANAERLELKARKLADSVLGAGKENKLARSNIFLLENQTDDSVNVQLEGTALAVYSGESYAPVGAFVLFSDISGEFVDTSMNDIESSLYVVNSKGEFISHPEASLETLRGATEQYNLANEFPGLNFEKLLSSGDAAGTIYRKPDGSEWVIGADRLKVNGNNDGESLLYIFASPREEVEMVASEIGYEMQQVAQGVLLFAIVLGWFIAQRLANPVKEISAAALDFGRDGTVRELRLDGRDEIGMLAKSLTDMMNEVNGQRGKLMLLAAAVESSVDSIIITDNNGRITYVNPHYERYSGAEAGSLIGLTSNQLPEFKDYTKVLSESTSQKGGETVWTGQYSWRRADGKIHDESLSISPIRNANGDIVSHSMVIQDITERREMEKSIERQTEELKRSNKDLEQFAYVASHDLKAPLRAIEVILEWLRDDLEDYNEGDVQENLDLLSQRTSRLGRLLDDLLAYSRAGRQVGDVRQLDMKEFVEDIATLVAPPEGFVIEADESLPCIFAHHAPLETVMRNLINNAIKHHPDPANGHIRVSAKDQGDSVVFAVEDNGEGIPEEYADKVFKMFQTLKPRDEREGSGMGLAIVQRIINWQNGSIWFKEGADGKGVVFKFVWHKVPHERPEIDMEDDADEQGGEMEMAG